jgi:hypothetical protein
MGNQRFRFGQLQFELILQELPELLLDLHRFGLRAAEAEEDIVGVPAIAQPSISGIVKILAGHQATLPA